MDLSPETKVYLKKRFKNFFWKNTIPAPNQIYKREFGVGTLEDKIKFRHKSFTTDRELNQYLKTDAPYYISYSAAYYEFPQQPMAEKVWRGADLIFDLDKQMDFLDKKLMDEVTVEAQSLYDFLLDDFGFSKDEISVNFSGSKGYHLHVQTESVKQLDSNARRDIIDYISGNGLDVESFLKTQDATRGIRFRHGRPSGVAQKLLGPTAQSTGWAKRLYDVTEEILSLDFEELKSIKGVGVKTAEKIVTEREKNLKHLGEGRWTAFWGLFNAKMKNRILSRAIKITDDDKQVTGDISRLIRLPETIHGGSGLIAKKVNSIHDFDPLTQTIAFNDGEIKIKLKNEIPQFDLMENSWGKYGLGQVVDVPDYVGIYLMLKGKAEIA